METQESRPNAVSRLFGAGIRSLQRWLTRQKSDGLRLLLLLVAAILLAATTEYSTALLSAGIDRLSGDGEASVHLGKVLVGLILCGVLYLVAGLVVPSVLVRLVQPVARLVEVRAATVRRRPVLILPISSTRDDTPKALMDFIDAMAGGTLPTPSKDDPDAVKAALLANWLPPLRSIERQLPTLRRVYLVGSAQATTSTGTTIPGSFRQLPRFVEVVQHLLAKRAAAGLPVPEIEFVAVQKGELDVAVTGDGGEDFTSAERGVNFNSYETLLETYGHAIDRAGKAGFEEGEIYLDITPGTKQVSVAGAIITLNRDVVICYVDTNTTEVVFHDGRLTREYGMTEFSQD